MLDPAVSWRACPTCSGESNTLVRLQDQLARLLVRKLDREAAHWQEHHGWRVADLPNGQRLFRWRDLACVAPAPESPVEGWMLVSPLGIMRQLDRRHCRYHLAKAGAPELP